MASQGGPDHVIRGSHVSGLPCQETFKGGLKAPAKVRVKQAVIRREACAAVRGIHTENTLPATATCTYMIPYIWWRRIFTRPLPQSESPLQGAVLVDRWCVRSEVCCRKGKSIFVWQLHLGVQHLVGSEAVDLPAVVVEDMGDMESPCSSVTRIVTASEPCPASEHFPVSHKAT